ncbi:hypothetical protein EG329_004267 [Mollisiaceae sp. DMI_Dod_QoI]|nr:hypothetical protein EG329_004267 [Helotiales sp. DMI_Dod_QoI]
MSVNDFVWLTQEDLRHAEEQLVGIQLEIEGLDKQYGGEEGDELRKEYAHVIEFSREYGDLRGKVSHLSNRIFMREEMTCDPTYYGLPEHFELERATFTSIKTAIIDLGITVRDTVEMLRDPDKYHLKAYNLELQKDKNTLELENCKLQEDKNTLELENSKLQEDRNTLGLQNSELQEHGYKLEVENLELRRQWETQGKKIESVAAMAQEQRFEFSKFRNNWRQESEQSNAKICKLEKEKYDSVILAESYLNDKTRLEVDNRNISELARQLQDQIQKKEAIIAQLNESRTALQENNTLLRKEGATLLESVRMSELSVENLNAKVSTLQSDNVSLKARVDFLEREVSSLKGEKAGLSRQMQEAETALSSIHAISGKWGNGLQSLPPNSPNMGQTLRGESENPRNEDDENRPDTFVGSRRDPNEGRPGYHKRHGHWAKNPVRKKGEKRGSS